MSDDGRVVGHAVGDIDEGEDMAVVPWTDWARLRLIEEKARSVHDSAIVHDGDHYLVLGDAMAELEAAFEGRHSDI